MWKLSLIVLLGAGRAPVVPEAGQCQRLVVVMPRDEWRLTINRDGGSRINYAALPQTAESARGTFRFSEVYSRLRARVELSCSDEVQGAVEFVRDAKAPESTPWCITDERYAAALFELAWDRVRPPSDAVGREHVELLRSMWVRRKAPRSRPDPLGDGGGRQGDDVASSQCSGSASRGHVLWWSA